MISLVLPALLVRALRHALYMPIELCRWAGVLPMWLVHLTVAIDRPLRAMLRRVRY